MLRDSSVAAVVGTHPQAKLLAMTAMTKSNHGLPLVPYMGMGLCLAALWAVGAPLSYTI